MTTPYRHVPTKEVAFVLDVPASGRSFRHALSHWLGWDKGEVVTFKTDDHWYVGHQCATCKCISNPTHMFSCECLYPPTPEVWGSTLEKPFPHRLHPEGLPGKTA